MLKRVELDVCYTLFDGQRGFPTHGWTDQQMDQLEWNKIEPCKIDWIEGLVPGVQLYHAHRNECLETHRFYAVHPRMSTRGNILSLITEEAYRKDLQCWDCNARPPQEILDYYVPIMVKEDTVEGDER